MAGSSAARTVDGWHATAATARSPQAAKRIARRTTGTSRIARVLGMGLTLRGGEASQPQRNLTSAALGPRWTDTYLSKPWGRYPIFIARPGNCSALVRR